MNNGQNILLLGPSWANKNIAIVRSFQRGRFKDQNILSSNLVVIIVTNYHMIDLLL